MLPPVASSCLLLLPVASRCLVFALLLASEAKICAPELASVVSQCLASPCLLLTSFPKIWRSVSGPGGVGRGLDSLSWARIIARKVASFVYPCIVALRLLLA